MGLVCQRFETQAHGQAYVDHIALLPTTAEDTEAILLFATYSLIRAGHFKAFTP